MCSSLYLKAAEVYSTLSALAEGIDTSIFWADMSADLKNYTVQIGQIQELVERPRIIEPLERPHETTEQLNRIDKKLDALLDSCKASQGVLDSLLLAYTLEIYLVDSAIASVVRPLVNISSDEILRKQYDEHIHRLVSGFRRYCNAHPHLITLTESLQWVYEANRISGTNGIGPNIIDMPDLRGALRIIRPLASLARRNEYTIAVFLVNSTTLREVYSHRDHKAYYRLLTSTHNSIKSIIRTSDILCRYDSDTFLVYLSRTKQTFLYHIGHRIMKHIHANEGVRSTGSVSIGGSYGYLRGDIETELSQYIEKAADCLTRARLAPKNKLLVE